MASKRTPVSEVIAFTASRTNKAKPMFHVSEYVNVSTNNGMYMHESLIELLLNQRERQAEREMLLHAQRESTMVKKKTNAKEVKKTTKPGCVKAKQAHNTSKVGLWVITENNRENTM